MWIDSKVIRSSWWITDCPQDLSADSATVFPPGGCLVKDAAVFWLESGGVYPQYGYRGADDS